ncbi:MAG TPA: MalY/PatB family protein [Anaerolineales bacterium]|nr:MalY/PatB family protein [Anaerolineales bacterium]
MMKYDLDHVPDRRPTDSIKWNQFDNDVLPMWVADMDYPVAEPILHALRERVDHGVFGYPGFVHPKPGTSTDLQELFVERMLNRYGWHVKPDEILLLPGVIVGLNLTCHALGSPGGGVLIQTPVYPPFFRTAANAGMVLQESMLKRPANGKYEVDWDDFEAAFTDRSRIFILCNPHNPVGRVYRQAELERMAEICLRHGVTICSDEIHCDLLYSGYRHIPIASLDDEIAQNTITLMSPTKTFNLAGLQCSFAIVQNPDLRKKMEQSMQGLVMWVNLMGMIAAIAAYRDGQEWLDQVLGYMESNRDYLAEYVAQQLPQIKMVKPEGTYLAWLDCRDANITGNPCEFFIQAARVGFNDGATFGKGGEGFVRLNFACTRATLTQALGQMKMCLE